MGWIEYTEDLNNSRRTAFCREYRQVPHAPRWVVSFPLTILIMNMRSDGFHRGEPPGGTRARGSATPPQG